MTFPSPKFDVLVSAGGCSCTPAYSTGNRSATITPSTDLTIGTGAVSAWVDGTTTDDSGTFFTGGQAVSGKEMKFDWGASASVKITEVKIYFGTGTGTDGTWVFEGSNDDSSWTTLGSNQALNGTGEIVDSSMSGNTTGYRYYRYRGVSGTTASSDRSAIDEVEFKECNC